MKPCAGTYVLGSTAREFPIQMMSIREGSVWCCFRALPGAPVKFVRSGGVLRSVLTRGNLRMPRDVAEANGWKFTAL